MSQVPITIDGRALTAAAGSTILDAALEAGIDIPHLCYDPRVAPRGSCRLCVVKLAGRPGLLSACHTPVAAGMNVTSEDDELAEHRRQILELTLSEHRTACVTCDADGSCSLQKYAYRYQADERRFGLPPIREQYPNFASTTLALSYDVEKCIRCGLCVQYCQDVQMAGALCFAGPAQSMEVSTAFGVALHESSCELCGGCIRVCPTKAINDRQAQGRGRIRDLKSVRTICTYCGVGCELKLLVDEEANSIVRADASPEAPINHGNLCVKGHFGHQFVSSPQRLTTPLIRAAAGFRQATWEEALTLIGQRLGQIRDQHGGDAVAFLSSSRCSNEENYLMQKLARMAGRTNHVDQCATTCHAATVEGLAAAFGSGAMTNSVAEIQDVDVLLLIGANPTEAHPIIGLEMKRALRRGAKLVVIDPRETWMARRADLHLKIRPGSDNILLNAMMGYILDEQLADLDFVARRCEDFDVFRENLRTVTIDDAARVCQVDAADIRTAARLYAQGKPGAIFYTLGITEHACGTDNVKNLANLAMLCGQIGKWASGVNPLRGQNNVQGACDMGAMPHKLPGYQNVHDPAVRQKFARAWGGELPSNRGGRVSDFMTWCESGKLKALYVMGEDPALSEPNQARTVAGLRKLDFLICQDIFLSATAEQAHVVLPATCWAEKEGTFTASERRVQRVRKAVNPPGAARLDWQILCQVATAMGYPLSYRDPQAIFDEMVGLTPLYGHMSYDRLEAKGLQWPCPGPNEPGLSFLHGGTFTRGKGRFHPITHQPPREEPDAQYPLLLSTGRTLYQYNVGSMTNRVPVITQKESENFVEIHEETAAKLGVAANALVQVRTRRGHVVARAHLGRRVRPDSIWMPFHFPASPTNALTNDVYDPDAGTAEYKCCAAVVELLPPPG